MKYWFYSEGNILGPYAPSELLALPAFGTDSLVCSEYATGDKPEDWIPAQSVKELSEAMSIGAGEVISSELSPISRMATLETGLSSNIEGLYDFKSYEPGYSYENILDTIDTILGTYKGSEETKPGADEDKELIDKFEVRLSKIQEELEAARWEKNILIEKIRLKEANEKKSQEKILKLEAQLKEALEKLQCQSIQEKISPVEEKGTVSIQEQSGKPSTEKSSETIQCKKLKNLKPVQLERIVKKEGSEKGIVPVQGQSLEESVPKIENCPVVETGKDVEKKSPAEEKGAVPIQEQSGKPSAEKSSETIQCKKLKSLKPVQLERIDKKEGSEEGSVPVEGQFLEESVPKTKTCPLVETGRDVEKKSPENFVEEKKEERIISPIPDTDYSFTGVAPLQKINQTAKIETPQGKIVPDKVQAPDDFKYQTIKITPPPTLGKMPVPPPIERYAGEKMPLPPSPGRITVTQGLSAPGEKQQTQTKAEEQKIVKGAEKAIPDKTQKIPIADLKPSERKNTGIESYKEKFTKNKIMFIVTLMVFAMIAAGGIGYFFFGGSLGLSEFSLLHFFTKKKYADKQNSTVQIQRPEATGYQKSHLFDTTISTPLSAQSPISAETSSKTYSNENVQTALNIVKNYRLGGGRGTISNWFANSFLSTSGAELNEEWTATLLHGNNYVVQYRLLRPRKEPLIYQFEVDIAKNLIVRGINNNAIELLDFPDREKVFKKQTSLKPIFARGLTNSKKVQKAQKRIPLLPLPEEPIVTENEVEPTGFENIPPDKDEKVKYLIAQESDEELF